MLVLACDGSAGTAPGAGGPDAGAPAAPRCLPAGGVARAPATIAEVVALVNDLPRPVTVACVVESLARPLEVHASRSIFSFQPSMGRRSPRLFLFGGGGGLIATVAVDGMGSHLLELGQFVDARRTIKAELKFPVDEALDRAAPFRQPRDGSGTTCRACHFGEEPAAGIDYAEAFVSVAFRPDPRERVELPALEAERASCDRAVEPGRCAMLDALFGHGEVRAREFPPELPTIVR